MFYDHHIPKCLKVVKRGVCPTILRSCMMQQLGFTRWNTCCRFIYAFSNLIWNKSKWQQMTQGQPVWTKEPSPWNADGNERERKKGDRGEETGSTVCLQLGALQRQCNNIPWLIHRPLELRNSEQKTWFKLLNPQKWAFTKERKLPRTHRSWT